MHIMVHPISNRKKTKKLKLATMAVHWGVHQGSQMCSVVRR